MKLFEALPRKLKLCVLADISGRRFRSLLHVLGHGLPSSSKFAFRNANGLVGQPVEFPRIAQQCGVALLPDGLQNGPDDFGD